MKLKITIKGKVHEVGYRIKLINLALEYGIDRFSALNAEINGKAPEEIIEIIKQRIKKEKPDKAVVESISFEDYKYEVPPIERCMQAFQMEHWGKAIPILLDMRDRIDSVGDKVDLTREELGRKIDEVGKKVDKVGEKVDMTREELGKKIDSVAEKVDSFGDKVDTLRSDMKEYIEVNLKEIHSKISEIEKALKKAGIM